MMQQDFDQAPSWPFYHVINSTIDQLGNYSLNNMEYFDHELTNCEFSPSFTSTHDHDSSPISSISYSPVYDDDDVSLEEAFRMEDLSMDLGGVESILSCEIDDMYGCFEDSTEDHQTWSPTPSMNSNEASTDVSSNNQTSVLTLPAGEDMEIDNQLIILHLLKACSEAMENEQRELAEVILKCIAEKVNPIGSALERIAIILADNLEKKQDDYVKQESNKNFEAAFRAFYQIFPYGRFAHFVANSAILEAMPIDAEMIHIVDFDMGEGIQWPPMIESIARKCKSMRLTSIKWDEEGCGYIPSDEWRFAETRRRIYDHARSLGPKLKIDEMTMDEVVSEMKRIKKRGGRREWLAFNCMVGLPHMGRGRSRRLVKEFMTRAKDLIANSSNTSNKGVLILGDGDHRNEKTGLASFFEGQLVHYQALLESMESSFPNQFMEGRLAMEALFVEPYVSTGAWFQKWEEIKEGCDPKTEMGWEGLRLSKESLMEAKELVKENESLYGVSTSQNGNEMVLEWRGNQIVKVSTWRN